jgi:hypothetical protein
MMSLGARMVYVVYGRFRAFSEAILVPMGTITIVQMCLRATLINSDVHL